jgi:hypothetical protein
VALRRRIFRETPALVRLDSSCCAMERYCEPAVEASVPVAARRIAM